MAVDRVDAQANNLDVPLFELGLDPGHVAKLGGAHWREVFQATEQHTP
jgi:hypothetical protein